MGKVTTKIFWKYLGMKTRKVISYKKQCNRKKLFKTHKKKKTFINWIKEHGVISFDWRDKPEEILPSSTDKDLSVGDVINRIVTFVGFKFKF
jgi:hypothetical protein